jgi:hypothetical protein
MEQNTDNLDIQESEIYADWFVVKQHIWIAWDKLTNNFTELVKYKLSNIPPQKSRIYNKCCINIVNTYIKIGTSRFKTYLSEDKQEFLKKIYGDILSGYKPKFKEISVFIEIVDEWLSNSGMGKIDREVIDLGKSVLHR